MKFYGEDENGAGAEVSPYLGWALWVSEIWYSWMAITECPRQRLHARARGIVLFDRVLNGERGRATARLLEAA